MSNILPYHHKKEIHQIRVLRLATVTIWALVILALTAAVLLIPQLVMVNDHYAIATQQVSQLEQSGVVTNLVDIVSLEGKVTNLSNKLASPVIPAPTTYIAIVRAVSAPGITLTGFSMEGNTQTSRLAVAGSSTSREALQRFVATLEQIPEVSSVDSPVSNYVKSGANTFQITITFK